MNLRNLMTISAILCFFFGIGFAITPIQTLSLYGVTTDEIGLILARFFGSAMLGYAILTWFARGVDEGPGKRAIVLALFLSSVLAAIVAIWAQLAGYFSAFGWIGVVLFPLFALGYGYFFFVKPHRTVPPLT
jgi:hypothetical protein